MSLHPRFVAWVQRAFKKKPGFGLENKKKKIAGDGGLWRTRSGEKRPKKISWYGLEVTELRHARGHG